MTSIASGAVLEVPQIMLNYLSGHSEGMSVLFVFLWLIGDSLNVMGCTLADTVRFYYIIGLFASEKWPRARGARGGWCGRLVFIHNLRFV